MPLKIALIYSIFGYSWIILTDALVFDIKTFSFNITFQLSILKGIIFVLITSLLIYYLLHAGVSILINERETFRKKEEMYRKFLDNINGIAVQVDKSLKPVFIHGNFENITGYSIPELFSTNSVWENLLPNKEKTRFYETVNKLFTTPNLELEDTYQIIRKDGKRAWVKGFIRNTCDEKGKPEYVQALYFDITKSKEMEEELLYQSYILNSVNDAVITSDPELKIRYWNRAAEKMYGWKREEVIGKTQVLKTRFLDTTMDEALKTLREKGEYFGRVIQYRKDGSPIHVQAKYSQLRDEKGNVIGYAGILRDITEIVTMEERLKKALEDLNRICENMSDVIGVFDLEGNVTYISPSIERLTDYKVDYVQGKSFLDLFIPEDMSILMNTLQSVISSRATFTTECRIKTFDGKILWVEVVLNPILEKGEKLSGIVFSIRDISERKMYEEELKASEEKFRTLVESMSDIVFILDRQQRHVGVFGQWLKTYNTSPEVFLGKTAREILGEEAAKVHEEANARALNGENVVYEWSLKRVNGKTSYFQTSLSPLRDSKGNIIGIVGVGRDITKLKEFEEQLQEYSRNLEKILEERTRQLKESERLAAIGEATMMIGHDLRNPLQAILNNIYIIKENILNALPERTIKVMKKKGMDNILKRIENEIAYMNKIVADLQDYSKPITPKYSRLHLPSLIDKILTITNVPENVSVNKEIKADIEYIVCDQTLLERILYNLILNAIQAMPNGGILTIKCEKEDSFVSINVMDTGVGIPENILPKIFTPFFTTKAKGQGLGLATCKRFVDILDGRIEVKSEVGKGSTFTIKIPFRK
ncbi:MAG: PAS domain S-box protein [Nitrososphaeria archaeon]|nr:PAS domain S-box protein [Nitrososphaeria archaeon]